MSATELQPVVVLCGGLSYERDVSLRSGRRVADALRTAGVEPVLLDADAGLLAALAEIKPRAVFPVLHGAAGEDGALRAVLDLAGVPYVGTPPDACRIAWDKPAAKAALRAAGVSTPAAVALPHTTFRELGASAVLGLLIERLGLPVMVKPARGGSALGAVRVDSADELPSAMVECFSYGDTALVECFVDGVEVAVSVLEVDGELTVLPAVEIVATTGVYDYSARYTAGATEFFAPARLDPDTATAVTDAALTAHRALGLRDLSRSDLLVAPDGAVQFLEVNVAPGMTETSLLPMAVTAGGLDFGAVCAGLVAAAADRG